MFKKWLKELWHDLNTPTNPFPVPAPKPKCRFCDNVPVICEGCKNHRMRNKEQEIQHEFISCAGCDGTGRWICHCKRNK
jgi:hypothetical protein